MTPADRALLGAVLAAVNGLRADLARRRGGHDPDDDVRLVHALAAAAGSHVFAAPDVLRHAGVSVDLAAALLAAGVRTSRQIGQALRRCRGRDCDGLTVVRVKRDERGALWAVTAVSGAQHTEP